MRATVPLRRRAATVAALIVTSLTLAACSGSGDETPNDPSSDDDLSLDSESLLPPAEGETEYPLTLTTPWGETVLEERPERITVTSVGSDVELLAALGVTPVAASEAVSTVGFALDGMSADLETTWEFSYDTEHPAEEIASTNPDLILALSSGGEALEAVFDRLSAIAPVLSPTDARDYVWQDAIRDLGEALDLADRAEQVITENETLYEELRAAHPELEGKTITYFAFWGGEYGASVLNTPGSASEENFSRLGFALNPQTEEFVADSGKISDELVSKLDADLILILSNTSDPEEFQDFIDQPLFQNLPAVQDGRTVTVEMTPDEEIVVNGETLEFRGHIGHQLGGVPGPLGGPYTAEKLAPYFVEALR